MPALSLQVADLRRHLAQSRQNAEQAQQRLLESKAELADAELRLVEVIDDGSTGQRVKSGNAINGDLQRSLAEARRQNVELEVQLAAAKAAVAAAQTSPAASPQVRGLCASKCDEYHFRSCQPPLLLAGGAQSSGPGFAGRSKTLT